MPEENLILSFKAPRSLRDKVDLAVRQHPDFFEDRSAALRSAAGLFLRTLGLIEEKEAEKPVDAQSSASPAEITIDSIFLTGAKP